MAAPRRRADQPSLRGRLGTALFVAGVALMAGGLAVAAQSGLPPASPDPPSQSYSLVPVAPAAGSTPVDATTPWPVPVVWGVPSPAASPAGASDPSIDQSPAPDSLLPDGPPADGGSAPTVAAAPTATVPATAAVAGIPSVVLSAYQDAEAAARRADPSCNLRWQILAGVGKIESDHARNGAVGPDGTMLRPLLGPVLDGSAGSAAINDTDQGLLDGDTRWDRAVGPMQFIPSTWDTWAATQRPTAGRPDPQNVFDAAMTAARYLCAGSLDLSRDSDLDRAILAYNHSAAYVADVRSWIGSYDHSVVPLPSRQDSPQAPALTAAPAMPSPAPSTVATPVPSPPVDAPTGPAPTPAAAAPTSPNAQAPTLTEPPASPGTPAPSADSEPPAATTAPAEPPATTAPAESPAATAAPTEVPSAGVSPSLANPTSAGSDPPTGAVPATPASPQG
ncbi:hypothetical protein OHV05_36475 (plasmid) [Kitasatospora sp. NBC_00070]|uniref:hypothetical protein n=1 Tax=Kitasatospora sp. NBC_00070 TaxID=2975962 RepID=UPI002F90B594